MRKEPAMIESTPFHNLSFEISLGVSPPEKINVRFSESNQWNESIIFKNCGQER
jgi:hypothetical protein